MLRSKNTKIKKRNAIALIIKLIKIVKNIDENYFILNEFLIFNMKWQMKHEKRKKNLDFIVVVSLQEMHRIHNRILIFVIERFHKLQMRYEIDLTSIKSTIQFSYHLIVKKYFRRNEKLFEQLRHSILCLRHWIWLFDRHFNSSIRIFNVNRKISKHAKLRFLEKKFEKQTNRCRFVVNNLNDQIDTRFVDFSNFNIEFSDLTKSKIVSIVTSMHWINDIQKWYLNHVMNDNFDRVQNVI